MQWNIGLNETDLHQEMTYDKLFDPEIAAILAMITLESRIL